MKVNITSLVLLVLLSMSCSNDKKSKPSKKIEKVENNTPQKTKTDSLSEFDQAKANLKSFEKGKIEHTKSLDNGVFIKWFKKSNGEKIKKGEMVLIEYRLALPDGKIIDGNNRVDYPFIPFVVGYNMQTPGWDIGLQQLAVGDFAKIEIPAALAMGEKGIKGVVPANSSNWLFVKVLARVTPGVNENGIVSWKWKDGEDQKNIDNSEKEISFHAIVSTESKSSVMNSYKSNFPLRYVPGQNTIVPGLKKLLKNAKKGERYIVILNSEKAYGSRGYTDLIKPNEKVLYNIEITEVRAI
ncbi:MAG: FKBP-type peptidyl-prolyl cis-trans isomerase [Crocinitomicaceae bacterium]|jgi:FKBP-type peptidyl-prolyl cis-trans isomerase